MAVIYQFSAYRAPRLLRDFSQQTQGVARQLNDLHGQLDNLHDHVDGIHETCDAFSARLGDFVTELDQASEISRKCLAACELSSVEQMIKKRDQIIREELHTTPHAAKHAHS